MGGTQQVTADGVIGRSGSPIRVSSIIVKSGAGGGGVVLVKNGTSTAGTEYDRITGTASISVVINYEEGLYLPSGCYIDLDANTDYVTVNYEVK